MNLNPYVCPLASIQGVVIGSKPWLDAGLHVSSHQTGGHGAYGWNHQHRVDDVFIRAAFSNYCARPNHYLNEPLRELNYNIAGRPKGWSPEEPEDRANGRRRYQTQLGNVDVTGIDMQHFWLDPLWAVIDMADEDDTVNGPLGPQPVVASARAVATSLMRSLAGMARVQDDSYAQGRSLARCLDSFLQAFKHRAIDKKDIPFWLDWLDQVALPNLEKAPGVGPVWGKPISPGVYYTNLYQSISWMLLPVWELAEAFDKADLSDPRNFAVRLRAVARRLSQWLVDIEEIKGGAAKWGRMTLTPAVMNGTPTGAALPSLMGAVSADDIGGDPWYRLWAVASADVAGEVLGTVEANAYATLVLSKALNNHKHDDKVWLVNRNRAPQWS